MKPRILRLVLSRTPVKIRRASLYLVFLCILLCPIGAVADCPNEPGDILFIVTRKTDFPPGDRWLLVTGHKFRRSQVEYDLSIESQRGLIDTAVPTDSVEL